jgi:type VI secretion system protein ImpK
MDSSVNTRRPDNLPLIFQEVFTAIERLRSNRQGVVDPQSFRHHTREALKTAAAQALAAGYPSGDVRLATFATVAFLDESVLNSQNPIFTDWLRRPLQEELFGTHIAGEVFFQHLQELLGRNDSRTSRICWRSTISACCSVSADATAWAIAGNWRRS